MSISIPVPAITFPAGRDKYRGLSGALRHAPGLDSRISFGNILEVAALRDLRPAPQSAQIFFPLEATLVPEIKALFWDVGGVLLSNAWDRTQRIRALQQFHLDEIEFHDRHEMVVSSLERGKITLDEYLDRTVFYRPRAFTREAFKDFIFSLSHADEATLRLARSIADSGKYLLSTINNESKELNAYRIQTFGLQDIFSMFVSSCYVGLRKPEPAIYQLALDISDRKPEECVFIDDRALNLDTARRLGMHTIEMKDAAQLGKSLQELGASW